MKFGPADRREAFIFALEEYRADIQYEILRAMKKAGMSQADLAKKMGTSAAFVSQILGDDANLTLETIVKASLALGFQPKFGFEPSGEHIAVALSDSAQPDAGDKWKELTAFGRRPAVGRRAGGTAALLLDAIRINSAQRKTVMIANDQPSHASMQVTEAA
ncbi:helix-turn-helix transcriptional regulator [Agrobacterium rhizogenes]|nr:helix-turn-helix transcriptional regulator [Rhizobium rhizogenes]NTI99290.1 helix-turn-helix transcriptional regulator [Rhizobium rhizogenes]